MKRLFVSSVALILAVVLAVPVSASNESGWIELLETNSVQANGDNWFTISGTSGSVTIPVGSEKRFRKIDMLIWNQSGYRPSTAKVTFGSSTTTLKVYAVGTYMTRIVGNVPNTWYENVTVSFTKSSSTSQTYEVLSCKMSSLDVQEYVCDASVVINGTTYSVGTQINISAAADATNTNTSLIRIDVKDWQKYDELSIWGSAYLMSIDSIRASISTSGLPLTTNYISVSDAGSDIFYDGMYGEVTPEYGYYLFCITIDLANVDRTKTDSLYVYLTGQWNRDFGPTFTCQYVNGHVFTADTSEVTFWVRFKEFLNTCFSGLTSAINTGFSNVSSWISSQTSSIVSSLSNGFSSVGSWISNQTQVLSNQLVGIWQEIETGFTNLGSWLEQYFGQSDPDAEDFADTMETEADQMQDAVDDLEQVTKPDVDDLDVSLDDFMDDESMDSLSGFLEVIFANNLIVTMLTVVLTCSLASYALFGKR